MAEAPDIEAPDIDVDESDTGYKRLVAVFVGLITLFGVIVAYLQAVESNAEDRAAREAQRKAVVGLGTQVDATSRFRTDSALATEIGLERQRAALNASLARERFNRTGAEDVLGGAAAARFEQIAAAVAAFTPVDPSDPATANEAFAEVNESPDAARLLQEVRADQANDHGGKADQYVAVLTVLAVGLFLVGLSLTVQGWSRFVLAVPGVAVGVLCVGATLLIARSEVTDVSDEATELAAAGQRALNAGRVDEAIDLFTEAIEDSPDFVDAYSRRAQAHFTGGILQSGQTLFPSITSEEARDLAIADLDTALAIGGDEDFDTVAQAGFFVFLDRDFERSTELTRSAIDLMSRDGALGDPEDFPNDSLAVLLFNLGVAEAAKGNEGAARRAYEDGLRVLASLPDQAVVPQILAGARTDLSILRTFLEDNEDEIPADVDEVRALIGANETRLAAFESERDCANFGLTCTGAPDGDVTLGAVVPSRRGGFVFADIPIVGMDPGDTVGAVWYFRTDDTLPFEQAARFPFEVVTVDDESFLQTSTLPVEVPPCPVAGEYLVRLYAGDRSLGEVTFPIEASPLGESFTEFADPVAGIEICQPEGFEGTPFDDPTTGEITIFVNTETTITFAAQTIPGLAESGGDPEAAAQDLLEGAFGGPVDLQETVLLGRSLLQRCFVDLPGFLAVGEDASGTPQTGAVAVDPDGNVRLILMIGTDDVNQMEELNDLVQFTGLDDDACL